MLLSSLCSATPHNDNPSRYLWQDATVKAELSTEHVCVASFIAGEGRLSLIPLDAAPTRVVLGWLLEAWVFVSSFLPLLSAESYRDVGASSSVSVIVSWAATSGR
jgi:hypothetical protein